MSREKKGVEHLSENDDIRLVKKHFHRLSKFLRYLDDHNATITIEKEGEEGTEKIVYISKAKTDVPKIRSLVQSALGISSNQVTDYYRTKLGSDDKHSNKDRIRKKLGDLLYGIKVQIKNDEENDRGFYSLSDLSFEKQYRKNCSKRFKIDLGDFSPSKEKAFTKYKNDGLDPYLMKLREGNIDAKQEKDELLFQFVNHHIRNFIESNTLIPFSQDVDYLNKQKIEFENHFLENKDPEYGTRLKVEILKLTRIYNRILHTYNGDAQTLPYYDDLSILGNFEMSKESILRNGGRDLKSFKESISDLERHDLIFFRHEIIELLLNEERNPIKWDTKLQALFVLCTCELHAIPTWIKMLANEVMEKIRFTIFYKFSSSEASAQLDDLALHDLEYILLKYHITDDPENVFRIKNENLLSEPLHQYPDYHTVSRRKADDTLHIKFSIFNHICERIREDLHLSSDILSKPD